MDLKKLVRDIAEAYPELVIENNAAVWDVLSLLFNQTGHKFIFVIDEWDAVFHSSFITEKATNHQRKSQRMV